LWFLTSAQQIFLFILPSKRLNIWSSWVKRKDATQVMYIAKLKDGAKMAKKTFSMILERVFEMV
jgi:hypothetical protein